VLFFLWLRSVTSVNRTIACKGMSKHHWAIIADYEKDLLAHKAFRGIKKNIKILSLDLADTILCCTITATKVI